jgi:hypothetical protein
MTDEGRQFLEDLANGLHFKPEGVSIYLWMKHYHNEITDKEYENYKRLEQL